MSAFLWVGVWVSLYVLFLVLVHSPKLGGQKDYERILAKKEKEANDALWRACHESDPALLRELGIETPAYERRLQDVQFGQLEGDIPAHSSPPLFYDSDDGVSFERYMQDRQALNAPSQAFLQEKLQAAILEDMQRGMQSSYQGISRGAYDPAMARPLHNSLTQRVLQDQSFQHPQHSPLGVGALFGGVGSNIFGPNQTRV